MRRGWLLNLTLLAAVAALAWLMHSTPARDAPAPPLSTQKPAQVRQIELLRPGQPDLRLERRVGQWWITAPWQARADEFQVLRMLTVLEAQPAAQFPATDTTRFDLQMPVAQLVIDGSSYAFGGINTVTREQYVLHDDAVYAVELRHGAGLPANAHALIRRVLLGENESPVAIELPDFSIRLDAGRWVMTPPGANLGQEDLQRYVDLWRQASAANAQPYDGRLPLAQVRMTLADGALLELGILQREPLTLLRRDSNLQFQFLAAAGKTLLARPALKNNQ